MSFCNFLLSRARNNRHRVNKNPGHGFDDTDSRNELVKEDTSIDYCYWYERDTILPPESQSLRRL